MRNSQWQLWMTSWLIAAATGCAGNGNGLDQNGQPISDSGSSGPITADFKSIQDNVFTPICSKCHIGAGAPQGLQLDAAHSYNLLVGVPSNEQPSLLRVKPSDPDDSYLVHKIEGLAGIDGGQMPLGQSPLPQATINAIRQWITDGASNSVAAAVSAQSFDLQTSAPVDGAAVMAPVNRVLVTFTRELDASLVNGSTITLEKLNPSSDDAADSLQPQSSLIAAKAMLARDNPSVLMIIPQVPLGSGEYRVTVRGTGGGAVADLRATPLGADRHVEFTVESE